MFRLSSFSGNQPVAGQLLLSTAHMLNSLKDLSKLRQKRLASGTFEMQRETFVHSWHHDTSNNIVLSKVLETHRPLRRTTLISSGLVQRTFVVYFCPESIPLLPKSFLAFSAKHGLCHPQSFCFWLGFTPIFRIGAFDLGVAHHNTTFPRAQRLVHE